MYIKKKTPRYVVIMYRFPDASKGFLLETPGHSLLLADRTAHRDEIAIRVNLTEGFLLCPGSNYVFNSYDPSAPKNPKR